MGMDFVHCGSVIDVFRASSFMLILSQDEPAYLAMIACPINGLLLMIAAES